MPKTKSDTRVPNGDGAVAPPVVARIEHWPLGRLQPLDRNPRAHSDEQIEEIAESIRRYGFLVPVIVDEKRGVILAGNGRYAAAVKLGLSEIPVVGVGHLTEAEQLAFVIADNTIATHASWNEEILAEYFQEIERLGLDPAAMTFFSEEEVERILSEFTGGHGTSEEDEAPEPEENPVSRSGDLWRLGDHAVLCGDATNIDEVRRACPTPAAMAFVDPPYDVGYRGSARQVMEGNAREPILNDDLGADWPPFIEKIVSNILASVTGAVYLCIGWSRVHTLREAWLAAGGHLSTLIVWSKHTFVMATSDYKPRHEMILYGWREGEAHPWYGPVGESNVWEIDKPAANPLHSTQKPLELVARAIRNSSKHEDTVLDLCAGSGTTLIAAEQLGRRCAAIELDPAYVDVIVKRWELLTGRTATLDATGETFVQVAEQRGVLCR